MCLDGQTDEEMIFFVMFIVSFASGVKYVLSVRLGNGTPADVRQPTVFAHNRDLIWANNCSINAY